MEQEIKIKTPDKKTIYGILNKTKRKKALGLIVYVHGLPSDINDYTYLASARQFAKKGYDTLRIALYYWKPNARILSDCSLETHATDLRTTLDLYMKKYDRVFLIGHSWGGPTIMETDCTGVKAISLWDPSYNSNKWWPDATYKKSNLHFMKGSFEFIISKAMNDAAIRMDMKYCQSLSKRVTLPLQVLHAKKNGILYKFKESYHTHAHGPTDYHLIAEADHSFLDETALKKAVEYTHQWFKRFS